MEYRNLGNSGVKVSTLCLGTMTFGEAADGSFMHKVGCDEPTSFAIMDRALDAGVNFFDTADVYGNDGLTERIIGNWLEESGKRDQVVLATKCRFRMEPGPNGTGASRLHIMRAVEASLSRLKTDRIDLYQIHLQDIDAPQEETMRALDDLVRQGKVLYIGCSNYTAYRLCEAAWISKTRGWAPFVALQAQYNLTERGLEREHVPACAHHGLGILPWSPLAGGLLTGKYRKGETPTEGRFGESSKFQFWYDRFNNDSNWAILEACETVAKETDASVPQIALAWLIHKPQVTSVIFGARSMAQLEDNLKAAQVELSDEQMQTLDNAGGFAMGSLYDFIKQVQGRW